MHPLPPPQKKFVWTPPHCSGNSSLASYFSLKNLDFSHPLPSGIPMTFIGPGGYGYFFWNHTISWSPAHIVGRQMLSSPFPVFLLSWGNGNMLVPQTWACLDWLICWILVKTKFQTVMIWTRRRPPRTQKVETQWCVMTKLPQRKVLKVKII